MARLLFAVIRPLVLAGFLLNATAFAGEVKFNVNFGNWRLGNGRQPQAVVPYPYAAPSYQTHYWYWVVQAPPAPPPPPQIIYIERDKEPPPEPPPPAVVVVQLPPVPPPTPLAVVPPPPAPVAVAPAAPVGPRLPGPDVFQWIDDNGVVNYSTRVPPDARKRAKKLSTLKN